MICIQNILLQAELDSSIYDQTYVVAGMAGTESSDERSWLTDYFCPIHRVSASIRLPYGVRGGVKR